MPTLGEGEELLTPRKGVERVQVGKSGSTKMLQIGSRLSLAQRQSLIDFFTDNLDVFVWSTSDLVGISPGIMTHRLAVKPTYPLVR